MTRKKKPTTSLVRSSAAEYLTFVAASGTGGVEAVYADENVWLSQKMMAQLYDVDVRTINYHLKTVFTDSELDEGTVIQDFRITAADGKTYETKHYSLSAVIAVGYKVNSERAVQFRKWATRVVEEFTIKGFAMDDERLKRGGSVLSDRYFEEQLQRIRESRLSERKFYQKITDIYATSVDYDLTAQATKRFFATVQNKLHWAIHGQTAAEVIVDRADATKEHMGLHTWTDAPHGKIQTFDVVVPKNYLTESELAQLSRLVNAYLDVAEDMALRKIPMTMQDWETRLNRFLAATDREVLQDAGKVTAEIARAHAESEFEKYRIVQDRLFESDFDRIVEEAKRLESGDPPRPIATNQPKDRAAPKLTNEATSFRPARPSVTRERPETARPRVTVASFRADPMFPKVERAVASILANGKVVAPVDVIVSVGWLSAAHLEDWRFGRIPYLERVIDCNLSRLGRFLRILGFHCHDLKLVATPTAYVKWGKGPRTPLRFTKTHEAKLEKIYARHFIWPGKGPFHPPHARAVVSRDGEG